MRERRNVPQRRVLKSGAILFGGEEIPCTIRSISAAGACIEVETTIGIPAHFYFRSPGEDDLPCKVMWRNERRIGIHFRKNGEGPAVS
jgi:PilZ domain